MSSSCGRRLVCLDLTGTVFRFRKSPVATYKEVAGHYGLNVQENDIKRGFGQAWMRLSKEFPHFGGAHHKDSRRWWKDLIHDTMKGSFIVVTYDDKTVIKINGAFILSSKETSFNTFSTLYCAEALGKSYSHKVVDHLAADLYQHYSKTTLYEVYPDALGFLGLMRQRSNSDQLLLGVITNFDRRVHGILKDLSLSEHFDFVICSEEAAASKPSKRIFEAALAAAGTSKVSQAWHIGDDLEKDYFGAKDAGWKALLVDRQDQWRSDKRVAPEDICQDLMEAGEKLCNASVIL